MVSIVNDKLLSRRLFEVDFKFLFTFKTAVACVIINQPICRDGDKKHLEFLGNIQITSMAVSVNTGMLTCI